MKLFQISNKMLSLVMIGTLLFSCNQKTIDSDSRFTELKGSYLGQKPPGTTPEVFAAGIVSTNMFERDLAVSPLGDEIFFRVASRTGGKRRSTIVSVKLVNGIWTKPEVASFSGLYSDLEPFIQHDGKKLYFISDRPLKEGVENEYTFNMWFVEKTESGWNGPKPVGEPINGYGSVYYPSLTKTGTMYFTRMHNDNSELIYRSKLINGKYAEPELLPKEINTDSAKFNTFISPNEDYIIVPDYRENEGCGSTDYYVSFRDENDNWTELINLGCIINSPSWDYAPSLSPDGKYFFFQRDAWTTDIEGKKLNYEDLQNIQNGSGDIYWVDAKVITGLNPTKTNIK